MVTHPLKRWLRDKGEKQEDFAVRVRTSAASISRVVNGMAPGPALARRIVQATGGEVTFNDIYDPASEPSDRVA